MINVWFSFAGKPWTRRRSMLSQLCLVRSNLYGGDLRDGIQQMIPVRLAKRSFQPGLRVLPVGDRAAVFAFSGSG